MATAFLDSNILVYAFTADPRAETAQSLLERGGVTSVQGLNEFANVARRKLGMTWPELNSALADLRTLCSPILPLDITTHEDALSLAERHGFAFFDALMYRNRTSPGQVHDNLLGRYLIPGMVIVGTLCLVRCLSWSMFDRLEKEIRGGRDRRALRPFNVTEDSQDRMDQFHEPRRHSGVKR